MAKDQRYFVDVCLEIYVPDQGCGDNAVTNESKDANWFANEICSQTVSYTHLTLPTNCVV